MAVAQDPAASADAWLRRPGLVVVVGPPGCGRSTVLRRVAAAAPGRVFTGGGLAMLATVPAFALSRAVRVRLPAHDVHLLAEAVRSRVRGGLLVVDDLQFADPPTLAALPHLAPHCRILAALRTPHRLPDATADALRAAANAWLPVPPLPAGDAAGLARRTAPQLDDATIAALVERAGGNPLAVTALARHAAAGRGPTDIDQIGYAVAAALADLPRAARTALAALGLLGRPAPGSLLGAGLGDLLDAGLVEDGPDGYLPVSTYTAEVAAGLLDPAARAALHRRLAELTPPAEAARHLAAAGDPVAAYRRALTAADRTAGGDRAALLLFACALPGVPADPRVRVAAADALLAAGRPRDAVRVLTPPVPSGPSCPPAPVAPSSAAPAAFSPAAPVAPSPAAPSLAPPPADTPSPAAASPAGPPPASPSPAAFSLGAPLGVEADVLRGEALLQAGDPAAARAAVSPVPDAAGAPIVAARDRILLLAELALDPAGGADAAEKISARYSSPPAGVAAALAAVRAAHRAPGWDTQLAESAADRRDPAIARWSAWLLVEALAADGRLAESAAAARTAAAACAEALAYGWHTRFAAAESWAVALRGSQSPPAGPDPAAADQRVDASLSPTAADRAHRLAADLTDRALPDDARGYATAATALVEADTGLLAAARARLATAPEHPATAWVVREAAWLDGQPDRALHPPTRTPAGLLTGLHHITARWAAHDTGTGGPAPIPPDLPIPCRRTLTAWATGTGFAAAADTWADTAQRERVRCLIAAGLFDTDEQRAVDALLAAERLATTAGLTVLAGRARRGLRRHHVHRDTRGPRTGTGLTQRETDVLRLVAAGEPTRRIAGQLGITAETVDTHIRAGMRKLGARTRTEAAALAFALGEERR